METQTNVEKKNTYHQNAIDFFCSHNLRFARQIVKKKQPKESKQMSMLKLLAK